jgi:hypothetical protein
MWAQTGPDTHINKKKSSRTSQALPNNKMSVDPKIGYGLKYFLFRNIL